MPPPLSESLKHQFIVFLRQYYHSAPGKEYDPYQLVNTFKLYFNFLRKFADPRLTQCTPKQWVAYQMAVTEPECAIWRTRRGGKTVMLCLLEVFWALIQFGLYKGKVVHRCPAIPQLYQYEDWMGKNPFVTNIDNQSHFISILDSEAIWAGYTGKSNSDGYGASVLYEDEWGTIGTEELQNKYLQSTRIFIAEGPPYMKRHLMASTATFGSIFAKDMEQLQDREERDNKTLVHIMPWKDCPWITQEVIEEERRKHFDDPAFVPQQFECVLVPSQGLFFKPDKWHIMTEQETEIVRQHFPINLGGLDFNGKKYGHIAGLGHWDMNSNTLYIVEELTFDTTESISRWVKAHPKVDMEIEGTPKTDGYNAGFAQHLMELDTPCSYQSWESTTKDARLAILQGCQVRIDGSCKWAIKGFREAVFDPKSLVPRLLKTNTQHGLDYALHMIHSGGTLDFQRVATQDFHQSSLDRIKFTSRIY